MTIPNLITVARLLCVPALVYAMILGELQLAFGLFLAAGISDAVDGFIARHFNQRSELGTYLDPIADKLLLVSVFVMLTWLAVLPLWFLILVASRDILIVAAVLLSSLMAQPVTVKPILVSKATTAFQIGLALVVLGELAFDLNLSGVGHTLLILTSALTVLSAAAYLIDWLRHMSDD
ncbi:CDP-alcohol phosphatidyltransferase family protein [Georhizobium profundi]|jgi:cardiolipin synthase (CMP-forming)|uniref:CDP-diacylglycerol--glycerol-3-phosphate 3-phosphatidyltransferase n=1 Tax=Georhizobium profundi TaxID=2341112 RepID=A0A3Q8XTS7_9HYPH|nr:CDP-alcohol phosphatidyltransferase family protein [Georhizobium profundi]AZN73852.1 CDP-alcohol phosphatidyltransferase family protein [Georhizobium profundi]